MTVAELCTRRVEVSPPEEPVADAGRRMQEACVGTLVVVDALSRPIGIVTDRDLLMRCLAARREHRTRITDRHIAHNAGIVIVVAAAK